MGSEAKPFDCATISGKSSITVVFVNLTNSGELQRLRQIVNDLPSVLSLDLVEANDVYSRYEAKLSREGCRVVEQLEDRMLNDRIKITIIGSVLRVERL